MLKTGVYCLIYEPIKWTTFRTFSLYIPVAVFAAVVAVVFVCYALERVEKLLDLKEEDWKETSKVSEPIERTSANCSSTDWSVIKRMKRCRVYTAESTVPPKARMFDPLDCNPSRKE